MAMVKILVADPVSDLGLQVFHDQKNKFLVEVKTKLSPEDLKKAVVDVEAIIVRSETQISADILAAAKKVKIVGRARRHGTSTTSTSRRLPASKASWSSTSPAATRFPPRNTRWRFCSR